MSESIIPESVPIMALRGLTAFPNQLIHFDVGREKSILAVERAMKQDQKIFVVTQKSILDDDPTPEQLFHVGIVAHIKQVLKPQGETVRILIEGEYRAEVTDFTQLTPFMMGNIAPLADTVVEAKTPSVVALVRQSIASFEEYCTLMPKQLQESILQMMASQRPGFIADLIAQNATFSGKEKQSILEMLHPYHRLQKVYTLLNKELVILRLESKLQEQVQKNVDKNQQDYYLREQLKVIRTELGEEDEETELDGYEESIRELQLPEEHTEKLLKEVSRMRKQPPGSAESAVIRNYLDTCLELPWHTSTRERVDLNTAKRVLNEEHFGLEKVKERILETLAVRKLAPDMPCQILCLVGPPGVGKTSIAYSIAKSLGRKLARISLGGIHDEADIRGHRKTYIGAMPGRIMTAISQAGSNNPVVLFDEIDKMGADFKGDPSAALLEVLDAEQNSTFRDHYIELPFDLSKCMFITTANTTDTIPRPLLDRMEVIELSSYTDEEKLRIAIDHLLPKEQKKHGIKRNLMRVTPEAIREIITCYTRESGVRNLERELAALCRKTAAILVAQETPKRITINGTNLDSFLGIRRYLPDKMPTVDQVGLVTGLAWTAVGGVTLEVEVNVMEGTGKLEYTGNLGDVMKESVQAAMTYVRSRAERLHLPADFYKTKDIHVHFPEGAVPKDGPSAGVTICTALVSALTGAKVRRETAMTGEISIRGRVLAIGGLKEKTMAALRHGIRTVIIPKDNEKDLEEIDQTVRSALNFITVETVDSVIDAALIFSYPEQGNLSMPEAPALPLPLTERKKQGRKPTLRQ